MSVEISQVQNHVIRDTPPIQLKTPKQRIFSGRRAEIHQSTWPGCNEHWYKKELWYILYDFTCIFRSIQHFNAIGVHHSSKEY